MKYTFDDAIIEVTPLRKTEFGREFGFEIRPSDGTPWRSGKMVAGDAAKVAEIVRNAWHNGCLEVYQKYI